MKESVNIWNIQEFEGDGISCPVVPANLPWYKKMVLTFFRFGICPLCITSSIAFSIGKFFKRRFKNSPDSAIGVKKNKNALPQTSLGSN